MGHTEEYIIIDNYEFPSVMFDGKEVFGFASIEITYDSNEESWDYPLASAGSNSYTYPINIDFIFTAYVTDDDGEILYSEEDDEYPNLPYELEKMFMDHLSKNIVDIINDHS